MMRYATIIYFNAFFLWGLAACGAPGRFDLQEQAQNIIGTIPETAAAPEDSPEIIQLGRTLYMDPRLSKNDAVSCNSCHNVLENGTGSDNLRVSVGINGQFGTRNAPTVFNSAFHFAQFWDGRARTLEEQAQGPILNPVEMGMPGPEAVVRKISALPEYRRDFAKAFSGDASITFDRITRAIAAFERTLVTTDRFDRFQRGDLGAIDREETKGLELFLHTGCISCHSGPLLGGQFYRKIGIVQPYANTKDLGRYEITGEDSDRFLFKVPALRNVARTPPYFHDGGAPTLEEAVRQMAWMQLGRTLTDYEVYYIVKFLGALSGAPRGQEL